MHSGMIGWVEVMEPTAYQRWLAGGAEGSLASQGEKLFQKYACNTCHTDTATGRGPVLTGLYGKTQPLADNTSVVVDDNYIRESILNPAAKIAAGYQPIMPAFQGQVSEEDLIRLLAYIKSLGAPPATGVGVAIPGGPVMTPAGATPAPVTPAVPPNQ
jgi:cytochrome c oxidase subunit 2